MADFKSSFQGRLFTPKFLKNSTLAVCIARDGSVENEAYLDTYITYLRLILHCCLSYYRHYLQYSTVWQ
jgi:hypothetical protein